MSAPRPGTCADPGPGDMHCTEHPAHSHSHYDAGADSSWNDGQFDDGWYDEQPHRCDSAGCPGRPGDEPDEPEPQQTWQRPLRTWPSPQAEPGVVLHLTYDDTGRALVHEAVLAQLLIDAGWERKR